MEKLLPEKFFKLHEEICDTARGLSRRKNHDYATAGVESADALHNFRMVEHMGVCSTELGLMVRLSDKFSRLGVLMNTKELVADESKDDTLMDIINYAVILLIVRGEKE